MDGACISFVSIALRYVQSVFMTSQEITFKSNAVFMLNTCHSRLSKQRLDCSVFIAWTVVNV
jgi:hypothetical protein